MKRQQSGKSADYYKQSNENMRRETQMIAEMEANGSKVVRIDSMSSCGARLQTIHAETRLHHDYYPNAVAELYETWNAMRGREKGGDRPMTDITRLPKWAQALLADLTRERDEARALLPRRDAVPERMALPETWNTKEAVSGWDFNLYTGKVIPCCTVHNTHWKETSQPRSFGIQGGLRLYATRRDALIALRSAKVEEFAKVLAGIDGQIAKEGTKGE